MVRWKVALLGGAGGLAALLALACLGSGCANVRYLAQSAHGHLTLMASARPVSDWTQDPSTTEPLRARLELSQRMRDFAVHELKLPDNQSYRRYADLNRSAAVWNVVAAPPLSLKLQTWCFPVVGCVAYRGYYREDDARALAAALRQTGLEASVYPVPAYSTLGKLEWFGGDPLLNTFLQQHEGELAHLIFHELSHQVVFVPGDTTFNESFATAVERLGGQRWLTQHSTALVREQWARRESMRADFRALVLTHRNQLETLYASGVDDGAKQAGKLQIMQRLREAHQGIKAARWNGSTAYDAWFANANNAMLGIMASYNQWVPAFEAVFDLQGRDFDRFYAEVRRLADLPSEQRRATLDARMPR